MYSDTDLTFPHEYLKELREHQKSGTAIPRK